MSWPAACSPPAHMPVAGKTRTMKCTKSVRQDFTRHYVWQGWDEWMDEQTVGTSQFETHGSPDYYDSITGSSVHVSTTGTVQKHSPDRARAAKLPKAWPGLRFRPPEWLQSSSQLDSRRLILNITSNSSGTKC